MAYSFDDLVHACESDWRAYIEHEFVRTLGEGTLLIDFWQMGLERSL